MQERTDLPDRTSVAITEPLAATPKPAERLSALVPQGIGKAAPRPASGAGDPDGIPLGHLSDTCHSRLPGCWLPIIDNGVVPPDTDRLPHRVMKLALDLFARETGFSGPEIHDLFAEYTDALGPYQGWGGGSMSRWQIFDAGLNSMALQQQRAFLLELCDC